jgi:hypothetical protein
MIEMLEKLKRDFNAHIGFREKRPGVLQVIAPLFHEDGDMIDIFLDLPKESGGKLRLSDHGITLMRLSYGYDVDTPNKRKILYRILSENGVSEDRGRLYMDVEPESLYPAILQFAQTIAKVGNMQAFKREVVQSLFYEMVEEFITTSLTYYQPESHYLPIPERDDLEVDWRFHNRSRQIFLYAVKDNAKARLAALSCLEFQKREIPFKSVVVHEDFENGLSKKDQARITNAADKQFTSLPEFTSNGEAFFRREMTELVV